MNTIFWTLIDKTRFKPGPLKWLWTLPALLLGAAGMHTLGYLDYSSPVKALIYLLCEGVMLSLAWQFLYLKGGWVIWFMACLAAYLLLRL